MNAATSREQAGHPPLPVRGQTCGTTNPGGCDTAACTEIRAYALSGGCCRDDGTLDLTCVRKGAERSSGACKNRVLPNMNACIPANACNTTTTEIPVYPIRSAGAGVCTPGEGCGM